MLRLDLVMVFRRNEGQNSLSAVGSNAVFEFFDLQFEFKSYVCIFDRFHLISLPKHLTNDAFVNRGRTHVKGKF